MKRPWWIGLILVFVSVGVLVGGKEKGYSAEPVINAAQENSGQKVRYTDLVCRSLACYDGAYLEDGSDEEMIGVTALVLENTGETGIRRAQVVVLRDGQKLYFEASYIPPKGTVLVLEKNGAAYEGSGFDSCYCLTLIPGDFDRCEDRISVQEEASGLLVTNLTDSEITRVCLYYKQYYAQSALYLGGITYSTELYCLQPGESRSIRPYHFAAGYAQVVAAEVRGEDK